MHGDSVMTGHGPGCQDLLVCADGVIEPVLDAKGLNRLRGLGLAALEGGRLRLDARGRMLLHECVAELIADEPA